MTVRAENVIVSPTRVTAARTASLGSAPLAQVLAHAEDQEQPVVGARAEHQHDQQQLGETETFRPACAASPTSGPAMATAKNAGISVISGASSDRKISSSRIRMKISGHAFDLVARGARLGLLVDVDRDAGRPGAPATRAAARPCAIFARRSSISVVCVRLVSAGRRRTVPAAARPARRPTGPGRARRPRSAPYARSRCSVGQPGYVRRGQRCPG